LSIHPVRHAKQFKNHPLNPHISNDSAKGGIARSSTRIFQYGFVGASRKKWSAFRDGSRAERGRGRIADTSSGEGTMLANPGERSWGSEWSEEECTNPYGQSEPF
jgi:hypothetical protein